MTIVDSVPAAQARDAARTWLDGFAAAVQAGDAPAAAAMFRPDGYWRDALALTWDLRTFAGPDRIREGLAPVLPLRRPTGFALEDEFKGATFDRTGLVAMANTGQPNSGGSQFFVTVSKPRYLDGHYSIFGKVISGYDVAVRISERPVRGDRPIEPVSLDKVTITDHKPKPKKASATKAHAK